MWGEALASYFSDIFWYFLLPFVRKKKKKWNKRQTSICPPRAGRSCCRRRCSLCTKLWYWKGNYRQPLFGSERHFAEALCSSILCLLLPTRAGSDWAQPGAWWAEMKPDVSDGNPKVFLHHPERWGMWQQDHGACGRAHSRNAMAACPVTTTSHYLTFITEEKHYGPLKETINGCHWLQNVAGIAGALISPPPPLLCAA